MSEAKKPCLFDNSKECPVQKASETGIKDRVLRVELLQKACPICPIRLNMVKGKAGYGEM